MSRKFNPLVLVPAVALAIGFGVVNYSRGNSNVRESVSERNPVVRVVREKKVERIDKKRLIEILSRHEGRRDWAYDDSKGNRTVGVGCNLDSPGARQELEGVGANYDDVYHKRVPLNNFQIDALLNGDIDTAINDSRRYVGADVFDKMPVKAREVVINMSFMGYGSLSEFVNMRRALRRGDYNSAANEMIDSKWYRDVKGRGRELVEVMRSVD